MRPGSTLQQQVHHRVILSQHTIRPTDKNNKKHDFYRRKSITKKIKIKRRDRDYHCATFFFIFVVVENFRGLCNENGENRRQIFGKKFISFVEKKKSFRIFESLPSRNRGICKEIIDFSKIYSIGAEIGGWRSKAWPWGMRSSIRSCTKGSETLVLSFGASISLALFRFELVFPLWKHAGACARPVSRSFNIVKYGLNLGSQSALKITLGSHIEMAIFVIFNRSTEGFSSSPLRKWIFVDLSRFTIFSLIAEESRSSFVSNSSLNAAEIMEKNLNRRFEGKKKHGRRSKLLIFMQICHFGGNKCTNAFSSGLSWPMIRARRVCASRWFVAAGFLRFPVSCRANTRSPASMWKSKTNNKRTNTDVIAVLIDCTILFMYASVYVAEVIHTKYYACCFPVRANLTTNDITKTRTRRETREEKHVQFVSSILHHPSLYYFFSHFSTRFFFLIVIKKKNKFYNLEIESLRFWNKISKCLTESATPVDELCKLDDKLFYLEIWASARGRTRHACRTSDRGGSARRFAFVRLTSSRNTDNGRQDREDLPERNNLPGLVMKLLFLCFCFVNFFLG